MRIHGVLGIFIFHLAAVFYCSVTHAQFEGLQNKDYVEQLKQEGRVFDHGLIMSQPDTQAAYAITDALRRDAIKKGDNLQLFQADYSDITYLARYFPDQSERITVTLQNLILREQKQGNIVSEIKARKYLAGFLWNPLKEYEKSFEEYMQLNSRLNMLPREEFPLKSMTFFELGKAYFYFKEYDLAANFFKKVNKPPVTAKPEEATGYKPSLLYLAIIMQKLGKTDSSYHYLQQLDHFSTGLNDSTWQGIASGYMGYNHMDQGQYEKAAPLFQKGIDIAMQVKDTGWAIRQKLWLAELYFKLNNPEQAIPLVQWSQDHFKGNKSQSPDELTQLLYPMLAKQFAALGQTNKASLYLDSSIIINDKLYHDFSGLLLARAQQKTNLEEEKKIMEVKNAKAKERNIVLVFLFVLLPFVLYIHKLQQKKFLQKKQLNEALLRQQERELTMATDQLQLFSKKIANKNKLLDVLQSQFGELSTDLLPEFLQNNNLITSQDWDNFKTLFEKVHRGYLYNLRQKLPELSPVEIRYMALAKLNFSNKEMAFSMGVSPESIRVTLHRLRKKLNLPESTTIEDLVNSI